MQLFIQLLVNVTMVELQSTASTSSLSNAIADTPKQFFSPVAAGNS
jgi:hypothetical protein